MSLLNSIVTGDKVTIRDRFGKRRTGRAVMKGTYGWVLNMGGAHGTPGIADHDNVVDVRSSTGKAKYTGSNPGFFPTRSQYEKYLKARKDQWGPTFNDAYNKKQFGLTKAEYNQIHKIATDAVGPFERASYDQLRKSGSNPSKGGRSPRYCAVCGLGLTSVQTTATCPRCKDKRAGKRPFRKSNPGDHIVYERGWATVVEDRGLYTVMRNTTTYGYPDSSYKKDADGLSIAKARCDYLFKMNGNKPFSGLRRSQSSTRKDGRNPGHDAVIYIRRQRKWNPSSKRMAWMYTAHGAGGYGSAYMGEDVSLAKLKRQLKILYPKADVVWQGTSKLISRGNPRRRKISRKRRAKRKNPPRLVFGRYKKMKRGARRRYGKNRKSKAKRRKCSR